MSVCTIPVNDFIVKLTDLIVSMHVYVHTTVYIFSYFITSKTRIAHFALYLATPKFEGGYLDTTCIRILLLHDLPKSTLNNSSVVYKTNLTKWNIENVS